MNPCLLLPAMTQIAPPRGSLALVGNQINGEKHGNQNCLGVWLATPLHQNLLVRKTSTQRGEAVPKLHIVRLMTLRSLVYEQTDSTKCCLEELSRFKDIKDRKKKNFF